MSTLIYESQWEQYGTLTPEETAQIFKGIYEEFGKSNACMIGQVVDYAGETIPDNALVCDGSAYLRVDYPQLFAILDSTLKIDGDNFVTPDLRARVTIGENLDSNYQSLFELYEMNEAAGAERHLLTTAQMPSHGHSTFSHNHGVTEPIHLGILASFDVGVPIAVPSAVPSVTAGADVSIEPSGGGQYHNNMQPYRVIKKIIIAR